MRLELLGLRDVSVYPPGKEDWLAAGYPSEGTDARRTVADVTRRSAFDGIALGDVVPPGPSTFRPNVPVDEMLRYMRDRDLEAAPVTDPEGHLLGVVHREELA